MKVLHVIPSLSPRDGGPSFAMPLIAGALGRTGVEVDVATTVGDDEAALLNGNLGNGVRRDGVNFFYFHRQTEFYKTSRQMTHWLERHIRDYELIHIHALFSYSSYSAANVAIKQRVPYIVRPLGVLNRWGMQNRRRLLKRLSFRFIERRILQGAAAVHYTSQQEQLEAEESGVSNSFVVIPLGIDTAVFRELPSASAFYDRFPQAQGRDIILFLSRLDQKKGLDLLLEAFAEVNRGVRPRSSVASPAKPLLAIAGDGDEHYVVGLRRLAERLGIAHSVLWIGFLAGDDKLAAMSAATLFVLPSRSENFGIALVEAMAAGLPCVMSDQVGIAVDAKETDAGLVVPCEVEPLAAAMRRLLDDAELRKRLGQNARRLVDERFSLEAMSDSLVKLYDQVLTHQATEWREEIAHSVRG